MEDPYGDTSYDDASASVIVSEEVVPPPAADTLLREPILLKVNEDVQLPQYRPSSYNPIESLTVALTWTAPKTVDLEAICLVLDREGFELEQVSFAEVESQDGALVLSSLNLEGHEQLEVKFLPDLLSEDAHCVMFVLASFSGETFAEVSKVRMTISTTAKEEPSEDPSDVVESEDAEDANDASAYDSTDGDVTLTSEEASGVLPPAAEDQEDSHAQEGPPAQEDEESVASLITSFEVACASDDNALVVGNIYRRESTWRYQPANTSAAGDSVSEMAPHLRQSLRQGIVSGIPDIKQPQAPRPRPEPLTAEVAGHGLSDLDLTPDAMEFSYLTLTVEATLVTHIDCVATFKHLQHIRMPNNQITDISVLSKLNFLLTASFETNALSSWETVTPRPYLEEMNLSHNYIKDILPVKHPNLRVLSLQGNLVKRITNLREAIALRVLDLRGNSVQSLRDVAAPGVRELYLADNHIRLVGKGLFPNLHTLHLRNNRLSKLKGLESLKALTYLNLRDNRIAEYAEVQAISPLSKLKVLSLLGNPVQEEGDYEDYRLRIILLWPTMERLDKESVTKREIADATEMQRIEAEEARDEADEDNQSSNSMFLSDMSAMVDYPKGDASVN